MLQITALMDDRPSGRTGLIGEHGLSLLVRYGGRRILFDCGAGAGTLRNAHALGIDLHGLDAVVLSHSHYDHAAGYRDLTGQGLGSSILYTGPHFFEPKYSQNGTVCSDRSAGFDRAFLDAHGVCRREVTGVETPFPGAWLVGGFLRVNGFEQIPTRFVRKTAEGLQTDDFADEICMALEVSGGLAVLVGCSHPGILNMVTHVRNVLGKPVRAVFGGTHLVEADETRIETTIRRLEDLGVEILGFGHCSGETAEAAIRRQGKIRGCHLGAGDCVVLE